MDGTSDLATTIFSSSDQRAPGTGEFENRATVYEREPDGTITWVPQPEPGLSYDTAKTPVTYMGSSDALTHILFETHAQLTAGALAQPEGQGEALYDRTEGKTILVGVDSNGQLTSECGAALANVRLVNAADPLPGVRAVSSSGAAIAFLSPDPQASTHGGTLPACSEPTQLYVRESASTTVEASASQRSEPDPAGTKPVGYGGMSADGSKLFFSSSEMLTDAATSGGGLYEYDLGSGVLTFLTPDAGESAGARVQQVLAVSADGRRVYFRASGQLVAGQGVANSPNNVYMWEAGAEPAGPGHVAFVANAAVVSIIKGFVNATNESGSVFAFATPSSVTEYESENHVEVYVFDAATERLTCASCSPSGAPPVPGGTATLFEGTALISHPVANVSADGSRVFFESNEFLTPQVERQQTNVYEWNVPTEQLQLLSDAAGPYPSMFAGASADGDHAFFITADSLVAQDTDNGNADIYDAHVDGGFLEPPGPPSPCASQEGCRGSAAEPPSSPAATSTLPLGKGNLAPSEQEVASSTARIRVVYHAVRHFNAFVVVKVPAAGRLIANGRAVSRTTRKVDSATKVRLKVVLRPRFRNLLRRHRRSEIGMRLHLRFKPRQGKAMSVGVGLRFTPSAARRSSKRDIRHGRAGSARARPQQLSAAWMPQNARQTDQRSASTEGAQA